MPTTYSIPNLSIGAASALLLGAIACGQDGGGHDPRVSLSSFAEDTLLTGRVVENVTACQVDAVCYLRLDFADTTVVALYGTGERPPPPCDMTVEVSDAAFPLEEGDLVEVEVARCGTEGYYLRRVAKRLLPKTGTP